MAGNFRIRWVYIAQRIFIDSHILRTHDERYLSEWNSNSGIERNLHSRATWADGQYRGPDPEPFALLNQEMCNYNICLCQHRLGLFNYSPWRLSIFSQTASFSAQIWGSFSGREPLDHMFAHRQRKPAHWGLNSWWAGSFVPAGLLVSARSGVEGNHGILRSGAGNIFCRIYFGSILYFPCCLSCKEENATTLGGINVPTGKSSKYSISSGFMLKL